MNATEIYDLIPNNGRKSFYGKAKVIIIGSCHYLRSYDTIMGWIDHKDGSIHRCSDYKSYTTCAHVKSFTCGKVDFWSLPLEKKPTLKVIL